MANNKNFCETHGSATAAALRVAGFFGLILVLVPAQIIYTLFRPQEPYRVPMLFHRCLLRLIGLHLRVTGDMSTRSPTLFVSNHSSYLDVPVLAALIPASFVAKAEVESWPLIGYLSRLQRTIFIERRATRASEQSATLQQTLNDGRSLVLFPEGTSTEGHYALPFKSSLFSIVENVHAHLSPHIQPVSVTCTEIGSLPATRAWRPLYAWFGDMTFIKHLWNVFKIGDFTIDVTFHPAVAPTDFPNRKALAAYCQSEVSRGIEQSVTGRHILNKAAMKTIK